MAAQVAKLGYKYWKGKTAHGSDPRHETVKIDGKKKTVLREIPDFIPEHDRKVLQKAQDWAHFLDQGIHIGPIQVGWEAVIGLIPELGDVIGLILALQVISICGKVEGGLPKKTKSKMTRNMLIDFFIGLVPFLGDIADSFFKANTKNVKLLEDYLIGKYGPPGPEKHTRGLRLFSDDPDKGQKRLHDSQIEAVSHTWGGEDAKGEKQVYVPQREPRVQQQPLQQQRMQQQPLQQQPIQQQLQQQQQQAKSSWGWFGGRGKTQQSDPELGQGQPPPYSGTK